MAKPAFKARKTRERKKEPTRIVGPSLIPSYALELEYRKEIYDAILEAILPTHQRSGYAEDRLTVSSMQQLKVKAYAIVTRAVKRINKHSAMTTWEAIEKLAQDNLTVGPAPIDNLIRAQIETNVGLITNLAEESSTKLVELYNTHGVDASKIYPTLKEMVGNRAKLIANDQNAKIFTGLNTVRMVNSGLKTFIWDHSSAGKTPRKCHELRDGHEFLLEGGPEELKFLDGSDANFAFEGKKGDIGKPGYAINCRCRMRPSVSLDE